MGNLKIEKLDKMVKKAVIQVRDTMIRTLQENGIDYICITDIARQKNPVEPKDVVKNWMRVKNTLEYLGLWEKLNNLNFKGVEFDPLLNEAGNNAFTMSPWVSVEFELYLIKEFQRLKEQEQAQLGWSAKRELSKINYHIHTDAIKQNLIPEELSPARVSQVYANEADVLNVAMFGMTAFEWREAHPDLKGNIRDYATINELICLSNMENLNAVFIQEGMDQQERLLKLNRIAIQQMRVLADMDGRKLMK